MKFRLSSRQLHRLNLPGAMLMALLQRTPVVRVAAQAATILFESPVASVVRSLFVGGASLGAIHSLAGATILQATPGSAQNGLTTTVGANVQVAFTVTPTDTPPESWRVGGSVPPGLNFSGLTSAGSINVEGNGDLLLTGKPTTAGTYTVSLTAYEGPNESLIASQDYSYTITVGAGADTKPSFTTQPQARTVLVGAAVTFTAAASGSPAPTYQWQKGGAAIAGATGASFTINSVQLSDAGSYSVTATNTAGSTASNSVTLTVNEPSTAPAITTQPQSQTVNAGAAVTFTGAASGSPAPTYQWKKDGNAVAGATAATLTLTGVQAADAGAYTLVATNTAGSATSNAATLTVNVSSAPVFTAQPSGQTIATGNTVVFNATVTGATSYQWQHDGTNVAGATTNLLVIHNASGADAGSYSLVATNATGSTTSTAATLTVNNTSAADTGHLANLSVRTNSGSGDQVLNVGFAVGGANTSGAKPLLVRVTGPALAAFGVGGTMVDPTLTVQPLSSTTIVASNDNWGGSQGIRDASDAVGAFPISDPNSADAALTTSLSAGTYTALAAGKNNGTGIVLTEIYDATPPSSFTASTPRLTNISARAQAGTGDGVLIAGFVVAGSTGRTLLVRAIGPTLAGFGVSGTIPDPKLEIFVQNGPKLYENDNWGGSAALVNAGNSVGAFGITDPASKDAVLLITLPPGVYTAQVSGVNNGTGIALVELYEIP